MIFRLGFSFLLLGCCTFVQAAAHAPIGAQSVSTRLGILVDSTSAEHARDGLRVLAATPGSVADQLGLRAGDLLVDVNGTSLRDLGTDANGRALASATLNARIAGLPQSVPLRLSVVRDGITLAMNAPLHARASAQAQSGDDVARTSGCGRISTFDVAPRSAHQYHARIVQLDGSTPGSTGQQNYRVNVGVHTLLVSEDIPTLQMGLGEMGSLRQHTQKKLTVDVQADTTYMIGAQMHLDKVSQLKDGGYWDPVVWREIAHACH